MNKFRKHRLFVLTVPLILLVALLPWANAESIPPAAIGKAASPVNPSASAESRNLLEYLANLSGKGLISGQHDYLESPDEFTGKLKQATGNDAVLHGYELGALNGQSPDTIDRQREAVVRSAIDWHKSGGIVAMTFHENLPGTSPTWSNVSMSLSQSDFDAYVTPGTAQYDMLIADLDRTAVYLKQLQAAGVPVLWRPYHEMNGGWFWWGKKNNFSALWNIMYDRYVGKHKLDNLLWVWNPNAPNGWADAYASYYPGADKVDVLAADIYNNDFQQMYYDSLLKLADGKPIAIGESGELPDPEMLAKSQSKWVYMMTWGKMLTENNSQQIISSFMNADYTLSKNDFVRLTSKLAAAAGNGLRGEYFDNKELEGEPVISRTDANLNFTWRDTPPDTGIGNNYYSVRWQGRIQAPVTGTYTIKTVSDDGVRVWIDGKLIIDSWVPQNDVAREGSIRLKKNTRYKIKVEYFENRGKADMKLLWTRPDRQEEVIPSDALLLPR
ncbi:mannan endo-1,4-beta-mannosidase [Paenibacillus forsythiae]|uniref:Mannan endo-1,4-beta-mannosidase n=1 Tax=Paenibacillus forsythiae TaxID=365616 RepID=A0ABU3H8J4_9BACL|nr:glycosyl hydrolase [Paenibacillus forsythiae]MDT3427149.1 mannan endo-1,4-beta-mannosidase [Paenibacillus forsythiae]